MPRQRRGLKRPIAFPCFFTEDEDEFITRGSFQLGISKAEFVRRHVLKKGWNTLLEDLRLKQKDERDFAFRRAA